MPVRLGMMRKAESFTRFRAKPLTLLRATLPAVRGRFTRHRSYRPIARN